MGVGIACIDQLPISLDGFEFVEGIDSMDKHGSLSRNPFAIHNHVAGTVVAAI